MQLFAVNATGKSAPKPPYPVPHASDRSVDARRDQRRVLLAGARVLADDPTVSVQQVADEAHLRHALFGALSDALRLAHDPALGETDADEIGTQVAAIFVDGMHEKGAPA